MERTGTRLNSNQSPGGTFPFTATDACAHEYMMAETWDVRLTVKDDDGGETELVIVMIMA